MLSDNCSRSGSQKGKADYGLKHKYTSVSLRKLFREVVVVVVGGGGGGAVKTHAGRGKANGGDLHE